ncbi:serine/threonine-protein kinase RIO1-like [Uloborus diversus]|uniref:serine/threonine-protein kinase RIO1-like n=1 Tax=Uloborus diversus TaxID=327109 RepID=UPI0024092A05|nr:serine/threonine-protein kinase RIO1-like [Uloborus diversus]
MDAVSEKTERLGLDDLNCNDEESEEDFSDDGNYSIGIEDGVHSLKSITGSQSSAPGPNQQKKKENAYQPHESLYKKYLSRICVDKYQCSNLPESAVKLLHEEARKKELAKTKVKDKEQRATVEQVLDPRTRIILFKMLSKGVICEIEGCISTGKEANVYYAFSSNGVERAVKIYKTSILTFKDRDKYVTGDHRFRMGYCRSNPRKMVQTWAEKEMRNLWRIYSAGLPCPEPIKLKSHVLVMNFIGKDGWPAPLLKEVNLSEDKARELYLDCVIMIRNLFHKCKLIHADLSEYNLLYHSGKLVMIDVSQSVELEHPHAIEFLRKDCTNITDFFKKCGVPVMTVRELFEFVTDPNITDQNMDCYLEKAQEIAANRSEQEVPEEAKIDEEVFKQAYIPKRLNEVIDVENDIFSEDREILYQSVTGLKPSLVVVRDSGAKTEEESNEDESSGTDEGDDQEQSKTHVTAGRPRDESPDTKKERKKALKEARREKQQTKIPKHVKKRKEKLGRQSKK